MTSWLVSLALVACTSSPSVEQGSEAPPAAATVLVEAPAPEPPPKSAMKPDPGHLALFKSLPPVMSEPGVHLTAERVALGRMLYYDTRLSKNHDLSCNSCHPLDGFGADGQPLSPGHNGQLGSRNSPSVYNAAMQVAQFWDGRAKTIEEQALGPILNPVEMAMPDADAVVAVLGSIPGYVDAFAAAYPSDPTITFEKVGLAIGAFERKLLTPGRFDAYIAGDGSALTRQERQGLDEFVATGCPGCHIGPGLGGAMFQKVGAAKPFETTDVGRFAVSSKDSDKHVFKVPSLRNVGETAPYFHDGSVATLEEAVRLMAYHQLGKELEPEKLAQIVVFLEALTGEPDPAYIAMPELPESGPDTPAPDPS